MLKLPIVWRMPAIMLFIHFQNFKTSKAGRCYQIFFSIFPGPFHSRHPFRKFGSVVLPGWFFAAPKKIKKKNSKNQNAMCIG